MELIVIFLVRIKILIIMIYKNYMTEHFYFHKNL